MKELTLDMLFVIKELFWGCVGIGLMTSENNTICILGFSLILYVGNQLIKKFQ